MFAWLCTQVWTTPSVAQSHTVMPRPIRWEVTLLFISTPASAGQGDNPHQRAPPPADHPLGQTTRSSQVEAPGQRLDSGGGALLGQGRLSGWMSTWVISATHSLTPQGSQQDVETESLLFFAAEPNLTSERRRNKSITVSPRDTESTIKLPWGISGMRISL